MDKETSAEFGGEQAIYRVNIETSVEFGGEQSIYRVDIETSADGVSRPSTGWTS